MRGTTSGNTISSIDYSNWYTNYSNDISLASDWSLKEFIDTI